MKKLFATLTLLTLALPAGATPVSYDNAYTEALGERCEAGQVESCRELATVTKGNCAGPANSGCRYSLEIVNRAVDNGLMVSVPNVGYSRVETLNFCLNEVGVDKYQELMTDSQFEGFEGCMFEQT